MWPKETVETKRQKRKQQGSTEINLRTEDEKKNVCLESERPLSKASMLPEGKF